MDVTEFLLERIAQEEYFAQVTRLARNARERILAEVDATRRIVAEHAARTTDYLDDAPEQSCSRCGMPHEYPVPYPCRTLRLLALPYGDHPDYREEWRP